MRRTLEQAFDALDAQIKAWVEHEVKPDLRVFVYQPEDEAVVLQKLLSFADASAAAGRPLQLEDVGVGFRREVEQRQGMLDRLEKMDREHQMSDLEHLASGYLRRVLKQPLPNDVICRILMNTSALATFVSYSAIANELAGNGNGIPATIIAFPGEGDDRSLNMLGLRADTNYRVPRV